MTGILLILFAGSLVALAALALRHARLMSEKARLQSDLDHERRDAAEKSLILKTEFENLANRIFEEKGAAMVSRNEAKLGDLLVPLKEQLKHFQERVNTVHTESTQQSSALLEQIRQLQELSDRVSADATELADAIKGNSKTQGDWGELIVERILEASGLRQGPEGYESQSSFRDEERNLKRPDFVVHLPGDRSIILDSKVSLTAYERFINLPDEEDRAKALKEHLLSVRRHIEELDGKDYTQLLGSRTLDFVILCIPLEPAYQAALQNDPNLLYDLAGRRVVLTGPATLMITLKLIAQIWRRENEQRNAAVIAEQAGLMYNQVRLVLESVQDARARISGASGALDEALGRIQTGRGNLVKRVETLRDLGAKVKTPLPSEVIEAAGKREETDP